MVQRVPIFSSSDYILWIYLDLNQDFLCIRPFTGYIILSRPVILLYVNMMKMQ